jgi:hypothetical protein
VSSPYCALLRLIAGGALDFNMSTEDKDKIMKGMMDGTRNLDAWFVTGELMRLKHVFSFQV